MVEYFSVGGVDWGGRVSGLVVEEVFRGKCSVWVNGGNCALDADNLM